MNASTISLSTSLLSLAQDAEQEVGQLVFVDESSYEFVGGGALANNY